MAESSEHSTTDTDAATATGDATDTASRPQPDLLPIALKDLAIILAALSLWAAADTWYLVTGLWLAQVVVIGDAILVGLLLTALAHEWGHYAGALAVKAETRLITPARFSLFRFRFAYDDNSTEQFHWMTYGGHIAHWVITLLIFIALPMDSLGRIALIGAMMAFIAFATFFEYHIVKDTWAGADPGERLSEVTRRDFQHAAVVGALVGLFVIAGLA